MSRKVKLVRLNRNMTFENVERGGFSDQRLDFRADSSRLTVNRELGGIDVERGQQAFFVPWTSIDYVEYMPPEVKAAKEPPPAA